MRKEAVLIMSHGRAVKVASATHKTLRRGGFTGRIIVVIDSLDDQREIYERTFPGEVYVFDKVAAANATDTMENSGRLCSAVYARNVGTWEAAEKAGLTHFSVWDDDIVDLQHTFAPGARFLTKGRRVLQMDALFKLVWDYMDTAPVHCISFPRAGGFFGGPKGSRVRNGTRSSRKADGVYFFRTDKRLEFSGTMRSDASLSVLPASRGMLLISPDIAKFMAANVKQRVSGGLLSTYDALSDYVRASYTLLCSPSSYRIGFGKNVTEETSWTHAVPKIVEEALRK